LIAYGEKKAARALGCPDDVPWTLLTPHENRALTNHGQTLETLASRGGLSPDEIVAIIEERRWKFMLLSKSVPCLLTFIAGAEA